MGRIGSGDGDNSGIHGSSRFARTLEAVVAHRVDEEAVCKRDLEFGDSVIVSTRNSVYTLWSLGGDTFAVSGGWFDRNGDTPATVTVNGCTYGGSLIRYDVVAARGLFLEFGNNVSTTRIRDVRVVRWKSDAATPAALPC